MNKYARWAIVAAVVAGLGIIGYSMFSYWSSFTGAVGAWVEYILRTQDLSRLFVALILALIALTQLILAFVLRQRSRAFKQEIDTLSDLYQKEIDLLRREVDLLEGEKIEIAADFQVRDEMVRQERSALYASLRRLQGDAGIPLAEIGHHPGAGDPRLRCYAQSGEAIGDELGGAVLLEPQFGVTMDVAANGHETA